MANGMFFMHFILVMATGIFALICAVDMTCPTTALKWRTRAFGLLLFAGMLSWMIGSLSRPWQVEKTEVLPYSETILPNGQMIQPKTVNLNEKLKSRLMIVNKVKVIHHKTGPYCGVSYAGTIFDDVKLEVIRSDKEN
jgi:hypothetical protein